jgi:hypothetical protein
LRRLMSREGYKSIEPKGGFKDKGRNAVQVSKDTGRMTVFLYSVRKDWEKKLYEDLKKIEKHKHPCHEIVYATTAEPTQGEKDKTKKCQREVRMGLRIL